MPIELTPDQIFREKALTFLIPWIERDDPISLLPMVEDLRKYLQDGTLPEEHA